MKSRLPFGLSIPVLYVNPPVNRDARLIQEAARCGALGIVDRTVSRDRDHTPVADTPHGVRVRLADALEGGVAHGVTLALIPLEDAPEVSRLDAKSFSGIPTCVLVEAGSVGDARAAERAGAAGVIVKGNEGPGWVSETSGLVLLQEVLEAVDLPVFLQGGVSPRTAAGALRAGATGVVLDVHLLLSDEAATPEGLKEFLYGLGVPATVLLGEPWNQPCRVYGRIGTAMVRELTHQQQALTVNDFPAFRERVDQALQSPVEDPDRDSALLPLSEDIAVARMPAERSSRAADIFAAFSGDLARANYPWPFAEDSPLSREHGTRFPLVQGPMAHVSDNGEFLGAVSEAGALPMLAMGNMPPPIAREALELARAATGSAFGCGLIGLEVNRPVYEAHMRVMRETGPPPFAVLAAGSVGLAREIEAQGTTCYLHAPAPAMLRDALESGHRHFIFEGCESGGHIGTLGSLSVWSANLEALERVEAMGLDLAEVRVLFAGGLGSARGSAFVAGMVADLAARGLRVGLQMGTAYLATRESVATGAITPLYQKLVVEGAETAVVGKTVNTRARAAGTPMATSIVERERERLQQRLPLRERKEGYEHDNLGALRLAAKGCAIDPLTANSECPTFCTVPPDEQLERGLYLMGQVISLINEPLSMVELHRAMVNDGKAFFERSGDAAATIPSRVVSVPTVTASPEPVDPGEQGVSVEPIAIVGMGAVFPGSFGVESFWDQIVTGRSGIIEVPPGRWDAVDYYFDSDRSVKDKTYSKIGGFVTDFQFNPLEFRIPPSVARHMDRPQQMAIVCVAQAIADAGADLETFRRKRVGIIIGNSMGGENIDLHANRVSVPRTVARLREALQERDMDESMVEQLIRDVRARLLDGLPDITEDSLPGELPNVIAGRIANVFNLSGPNFTVDAACASTLAAVMNAVAELRAGGIDCAIAGGVDTAMHPSSFVKFSKVGALSPDGSRPFDEAANGFVMGEGAGIMILKRLSDAIRDGDRIYCTILGLGSSSDGRGKGITAPNAAGQERAIKSCYEACGLDLDSVTLIEAHGTSTPVGDTTELTVLDRLFRERGVEQGSVGIGSVKSQIGHLKSAAGAAGMIKVALSLYHKTLPPTINVKRVNPCIDWSGSPLRLLAEPQGWAVSTAAPRRAAVSAFGFGGTNFHAVLQEHIPGLRLVPARTGQAVHIADRESPPWPTPDGMDIRGEAWVIGGPSPGGLGARMDELELQVTEEGFATTARAFREDAATHAFRCGFAARDEDEVRAKVRALKSAGGDPKRIALLRAKGIWVSDGSSPKTDGGVAFLFPGQGSQYPYMLRDLAERYPIVADTLHEADDELLAHGMARITDSLYPAAESQAAGHVSDGDALKDTRILQPMILTANIALYRLLTAMGLKPAACAGHSLGEYAACVAAGVFSFGDALAAVAVRGREMARVSLEDPGLMMGIPADARVVEDILGKVDGYVVAANKNSPRQTVISGETGAVMQAGELFKAQGIEGVLLPVSAAFHSGVVAPAREPFMKTLRSLTVNAPTVPILSNVTGDFYPTGPAAPDHIRDLLGKQFAAPVEWVKTLRRLYSEGIRIFVEVGPKRVMTNLTIDTLGDDVIALPTNHPKKGGIGQLMEALAALAVEGIPLDPALDPSPLAAAPRSPGLRLVSGRESGPTPANDLPEPRRHTASRAGALDSLLDEELREMTEDPEFARYLELQANPFRALVKTGFQTYRKTILPMERTVREVASEGVDFQPVVVSGIAAGLPTDVRFPFDPENLDDLILGKSFIKQVPEDGRKDMLAKNIQRLFKGAQGEAELQIVDDLSGVIKLAGFFSEERLLEEYGVEEKMIQSMDVTTRLAIAAGIEALRDAGIPLVQQTRVTSNGKRLPDSWALPEPLRAETGIIFASAFPGLEALVTEVSREAASRHGAGARKRLIDFYTGLVGRVSDSKERESITRWFAEEFEALDVRDEGELYSFNRNFLMRIMVMAHGQLAQFLKAQGPNTHVDAACAGTTQAVLLARDWIRAGKAKRVLVVASDDVAGRTLLPWVGSGFLAMGAATTSGNLSEAALPFDDRRHGLILGSAAVGLMIERESLVEERGMEPIVAVEGGSSANSAYHGTRLNVEHIATVMEQVVGRWEQQTGRSRTELANDVFFMSHETYSPKRGGSSSAEIGALRAVFGEAARQIPISNTKGFTGHTMGVSVEDVAAMRCLQKGQLPPIPNLRQPDPDFADMNLSRGGPCTANHVLRLAAGFGSQIVIALYKVRSRAESRISDLMAHRSWLAEATGYEEPVVSVEQRILKVKPREALQPAAGTSEPAGTDVRAGQSQSMEAGSDRTRHTDGAVVATIMELLAEKTGYPVDMLDPELDLEADLGIDTVKQAEFISEVRETFHIPRIDGLKIADFPTISHIVGFVQSHTQANSALSSELSADHGGPSFDEQLAASTILKLLADKTGYPEDMLDLDLDLEADLGIDTVKQAEFISEVREAFGIPRIEGLKIGDFPTIRHIIGFVAERFVDSGEAREAQGGDERRDEDPVAESSAFSQPGLYEARLVPVDVRNGDISIEVDRLLVVGGSEEDFHEVRRTARQVGYMAPNAQAHWVHAADIPKMESDQRAGVINLLARNRGRAGLSDTLGLYLACAQTFEHGPAFLVTVVSEDGAFGFHHPAEEGYVPGAVCGATKAFAREYPGSRVRVVDAHPDLPVSSVCSYAFQALADRLPSEVAVGADGCFRVIRLVPAVPQAPEDAICPGDVVVVSGGARGITAACVERLAAQTPLTLVLLGRTELDARAENLAAYGPDDWDAEKSRIIERMKRDGVPLKPVTVDRELQVRKDQAEAFGNIKKLREMGSEVLYRSVDICDGQSVDRVMGEVAELCGRVDVVIHAAGIDAGKALRSKTLEQMERVVSVKVDGFANILTALERHGLPPRRIVAFGSVSGRFGNIAQVDYAAGNDGLAHQVRWADANLETRVTIIDWAPWSHIGMAVRGSVQQALERAGIDFIAPEAGAGLLYAELARGHGSPEVVAAGALGPFKDHAFETPEEQEAPATLDLAGQHAEVLVHLPGEYVRVDVTLDPLHPLLNHHRIDRAAVLPGVGGIEIMRSAAQLLSEDLCDASIGDARFNRPLKVFGEEPFHAQVEVWHVEPRNGGGPTYRARLASRFTNKEGAAVGDLRVHHECAFFPDGDRINVSVDLTPWKQTTWIADRDIYRVFFHDEGFQFLDVLRVEGHFQEARFRFQETRQRNVMFPDLVAPLIEAVFQASAGLCVAGREIMALPTAVERVHVHKTDGVPADGGVRLVDQRQGTDEESRKEFLFDAWVLDCSGDPLITLQGVKLIEVTRGVSFPGQIFEEVVSVDETVDSLHEQSNTLVTETLTEEEAEEFRSKKVTKRANEWVVGRIALKRSVQRLLACRDHVELPACDIRITADGNGKPQVEVSDGDGLTVGEVSLSHSNGLAIAAAACEEGFLGVGIDLEQVQDRSQAWVEDCFTPDEIHRARNARDPRRAFTAMWALKEAALKALGVGLRVDLKTIDVQAPEQGGRAVIVFHEEARDMVEGKRIRSLDAWAEHVDGVVVARVIARA